MASLAGMGDGKQQERDQENVYTATATAYYQRLISGPDIWRGRAASTSAFLATAAAAFGGALLLREPDPSGLVAIAGAACLLMYIVAAALLLNASLLKPLGVDAPNERDRAAWIEAVHRQVDKDRERVKKRVAAGSVAASVALILTGTTFLLSAVTDPPPRKGAVVLTKKGLHRVRQACPDARRMMDATVHHASAAVVRFQAVTASCSRHLLELQREDVALLLIDE